MFVINKFVGLWGVLLISFAGFAQTPVQPTIMIFPSDGLVEKLGHLKRVEVTGRMRTYQDYEQLFIKEGELRFAISQIQERFADRGFPLKDLEYTLKGLNTQEAFDAVENIEMDLKDILLREARPDIYLDLDYGHSGSGLQKTLIFSIRALDAYTKKAVASASNPGVANIQSNLAILLAEQVEKNMNNFQTLMQAHFDDIKVNGRIITLRIGAEERSGLQDFRRDRCGELPLNHTIREYVKRNTVNSAFTPGRVGVKEIFYEQVRIPLYDPNGFPMDASEWAYRLAEYLSGTCGGYPAIDNTSRLGEAFILFIKK